MQKQKSETSLPLCIAVYPAALHPCKTVNASKVAVLLFLIDVEVQLSGEDVVALFVAGNVGSAEKRLRVPRGLN